MKKKILWMGLSFLLVAALMLPACAEKVVEEEEEEAKWEFAFICAGPLANPFIAKVFNGWTAALDAFGVDTTAGLAEYDLAQTIDYVDAAIAAEVDGIFIFSWYEPSGLTPSIQQALNKGIDVVVMSVEYPSFTPEEVPFIGVDYVVQGHTIGEYMAAQLKAEGLVSDVNVVDFSTDLTSPLFVNRWEGFLSGLTDEGIGYTASRFGTPTDVAECIDTIKAYLLAHPETDVVFGTGSITTYAAVMALQALGYDPGEVKWTGVDLDPETEVGVRAGYGATNVDEVYSYGFLAAVVLYMRVEHGLVVGNLPVYTAMVDQDNVDEYTD